ncbi:MAG: Snf7 family protein, partial [Candidatus Bathyarchaeota archaeon]|nr:Snf7 family protein [Candidatus Bathyarchaeota archaeon]
MSERFVKRWEGKHADQPLTTRIKETFRPPGPLKPMLDMAARRIELQVHKLDQASERFSQRDKSLFAKIVDAYGKHDMEHAKVFANELAEIRKMEKMIMNARLALEQIVLRLKTVTELGDVLATLAPAVGVLKSVRVGLASFLPEADHELGEIGDMLSSIIMEAGQTTGLTLNFETANEDAQRILTEAAAVAEQRIKEKLPELPAILPTPPSQEKIQT